MNYVYDKKLVHDNAIWQAYRTAVNYPGSPIICTGDRYDDENDGTGRYSIMVDEKPDGRPTRIVVKRRPDKDTGTFRTLAVLERWDPEDRFVRALEAFINDHYWGTR